MVWIVILVSLNVHESVHNNENIKCSKGLKCVPLPSPILVPSACILFHSFQIIVLTARGVPAVSKYVLQSRRFHAGLSAVERFFPKPAEAITRCKCRNLQKVMRFLDSGKGTSTNTLTLTFGESYGNCSWPLVT